MSPLQQVCHNTGLQVHTCILKKSFELLRDLYSQLDATGRPKGTRHSLKLLLSYNISYNRMCHKIGFFTIAEFYSISIGSPARWDGEAGASRCPCEAKCYGSSQPNQKIPAKIIMFPAIFVFSSNREPQRTVLFPHINDRKMMIPQHLF